MNIHLTLPVTLAFCTLLLTSCNGSKTMTPKQAGEIEILEYCSSQDFRSDKDFFRVSASGKSASREHAKGKARVNAEANLGRTILADVELVVDNYLGATEANGNEETTAVFNQMARTTVNQMLSGAVDACNRLTQDPSGDYVSYIALELSGSELVSKYAERLSEDERTRAEFNYERFKETFEAEMAKQR